MRNIIIFGECKSLIKELVTTLIPGPNIEMSICNSIHVLTDNKSYCCVYGEGTVDFRMVNYLNAAKSILICYDMNGDRASYCPYWIETVRQYTEHIPITVVGLKMTDTIKENAEQLCEPYNVTHLVSNPMEDKVVREYLDQGKDLSSRKSFCCWL